ncbi:hypothetical protein MCP1_290035 [Candidatus Terasakiella magnetica]|nr:hypothetical protein MCP1_290035 [Candidatus Terasakiella magnetica]
MPHLIHWRSERLPHAPEQRIKTHCVLAKEQSARYALNRYEVFNAVTHFIRSRKADGLEATNTAILDSKWRPHPG